MTVMYLSMQTCQYGKSQKKKEPPSRWDVHDYSSCDRMVVSYQLYSCLDDGEVV